MLLSIQKLEKLKKNPDDAKFITTIEFNKFLGTIFDENLKQANLATNADLANVEQRAIENKKPKKNKKHVIQILFMGKSSLSYDISRNLFIF